MAFAMDIRWTSGEPVSLDAVTRFGHAFRPTDDSVCLWVEDGTPGTLRVEFDVEDFDYDVAIQDAMQEVRSAAVQCQLGGEIQEVVAMTDEGQSRLVR